MLNDADGGISILSKALEARALRTFFSASAPWEELGTAEGSMNPRYS